MHARMLGLDGVDLGEGTHVHVPTLGCNHCGGCVILRPDRKRERPYCRLCDHYICDVCDPIRREADYQHLTIKGIIDAVSSGKYVLAPGPMSRAKLIPVEALAQLILF